MSIPTEEDKEEIMITQAQQFAEFVMNNTNIEESIGEDGILTITYKLEQDIFTLYNNFLGGDN